MKELSRVRISLPITVFVPVMIIAMGIGIIIGQGGYDFSVIKDFIAFLR